MGSKIQTWVWNIVPIKKKKDLVDFLMSYEMTNFS